MVSELPCTAGFVQGLRYDMIQYRPEMRMAKRDNGSSVSYTTRPFVRRPPALC